MNQVTTQD
jgi:hypothetical protein